MENLFQNHEYCRQFLEALYGYMCRKAQEDGKDYSFKLGSELDKAELKALADFFHEMVGWVVFDETDIADDIMEAVYRMLSAHPGYNELEVEFEHECDTLTILPYSEFEPDYNKSFVSVIDIDPEHAEYYIAKMLSRRKLCSNSKALLFAKAAVAGHLLDRTEAMRLLLDKYMENCGISISYRSMYYNATEGIYYTDRANDNEIMFLHLTELNSEYTHDLDEYDICPLKNRELVDMALEDMDGDVDNPLFQALCYGLWRFFYRGSTFTKLIDEDEWLEDTSVFVLRQLMYDHSDDESLKMDDDAERSIWVGGEWLFKRRTAAERQMHRVVLEHDADTYCFFIAEMPLVAKTNLSALNYGSINCQRYNAKGEEEVRSLCMGLDCGDADFRADKKVFTGRPAEMCIFQPGDIVEVLSGHEVIPSIVVEVPTPPEWFNEQLARGISGFASDTSDDCYVVVDKDACHSHPSVFDVFTPRYPISYEAHVKLKEAYKKFKNEEGQ